MRILARHRLPTLTLTAALAFGLAACGDDGSDAAEAPETTEAAATDDDPADESSADDGSTDDGSTDVVEVSLYDFSFGDLPATVPAGTRLTVTNEADEELHELVAFRLADDEDRSAEQLAELPQEALLPALGEPAAVLLAAPGGDPIPAVGDGTLEEPGRYAIFCFIPTGVEPQTYLDAAAESEEGPPQIEDAGPPHFVHGMLGELTVE